MVDEDLSYWTMVDLARRMRAREVSPVEVTRTILDRIAALDGKLHSYLTVLHDAAMDQAKRAESEMAAGRYRGPLHGVPIGLKDLCATKGIRTTAGTEVLRDWVPDEDACVVERLKTAGAVILGKLTLTEGAYAAHHPSVAIPINPWDAKSWVGVSSSGSGVATASGLCFGALGTDTGGSIRFPSACNGIVGIKPTYGRVSRRGIFPLAASLDHVGPMTRAVADAAIVLGAIAGQDPRDPTALRAPVPDYLARLGHEIRGLRIGVDEQYCKAGMDAEITRLVLDCAGVFRDLGVEIREIRVPPVDELALSWAAVAGAEAAVAHERYFPSHAEQYGPAFRLFLDSGRRLAAMDYAKVHALRLAFAGQLAALFEEIDALLCPSLGVFVPAEPGLSAGDVEAVRRIMRFTAAFDFSGSPTISLPCGFTSIGVPASLQLVGRHLEEDLLCRAAHAYEQATEWHRRRPPLAGARRSA
jgi:amidase